MILDFRLKVFTTTARLGSFSRAARMLDISQPAVSQNIFELESDIGADLFIRERGKSITLTEKGKSLLEYSEKIISLYERLNAELVPGVGGSGDRAEVRIASVRLAVQFILPEAIQKFSNVYPNVAITVVERTDEEIQGLLKDGMIDLAITEKELGAGSSPLAELSAAGSARPFITLWSTVGEDTSKRGIVRNFILNILTL